MKMPKHQLEATMREVYAQMEELARFRINLWKNEVIYHQEFWFSILMSIIPWVIWWKVRKKESTDRLLYAGILILLVTTILDQIGSSLGWWYYLYEADPILPAYLPWNSALVPVSVMLMLQFKPHWHPLVKGILYGMLTAFVGDTFFEWQGNYVPLNWSVWKSLPLYILLYLLAHSLAYHRNRFTNLREDASQK